MKRPDVRRRAGGVWRVRRPVDRFAELFLYPGDGHLFADSSLGDFDEEAAALLKKRTLAFLEAAG